MDRDPLEILWDSLLSRNEKQIRAAYERLDPASRNEVMQHLLRMSTEEGWHPEQRKSAQSALLALSSPTKPEK
ncbi:MAG: hypothetical protein ACYC11_04020 [Bellilinea sp.]